MTHYSKLTSANMTGLLATIYQQVSSLPCFSGYRVQNFTDDFFESISKHSNTAVSAKTLTQQTAIMTEILVELRDKLIRNGKKMEMGTVNWRKVNGMDLFKGGEEILNMVVEGRCKFFLGKS